MKNLLLTALVLVGFAGLNAGMKNNGSQVNGNKKATTGFEAPSETEPATTGFQTGSASEEMSAEEQPSATESETQTSSAY